MSTAGGGPRHAKRSGRGFFAAIREDVLLYVASVLLLFAMGWAAIYHVRYANVDESVVPGKVRIYEQGESGRECLLFLDIADDMSATVRYHGWRLRGIFMLRGAEEDTVLYQLINAEVVGSAPEEAAEAEESPDLKPPALLVRMPRSGLQGDFTGPWMTYLSYGTDYTTSDWLFVEDNGVARVGYSDTSNALTIMRKDLLEETTPATWEYALEGIVLSSEE